MSSVSFGEAPTAVRTWPSWTMPEIVTADSVGAISITVAVVVKATLVVAAVPSSVTSVTTTEIFWPSSASLTV